MSEEQAEARDLPRGFGAAGRLEELLARAEERAAWADIRRALAEGVRATRLGLRFSQRDVAELIGSSQPRVSMMEAAHPSVSPTLMLRTLVRLGARRRDLARLLAD